jgi:hypothetical protein
MYFVSKYENRRMNSVGIVLRGEEGQGRMMEGINPTMIYFKHICKYHSISPVQLLHANRIIKNFVIKENHVSFSDFRGKEGNLNFKVANWREMTGTAHIFQKLTTLLYPFYISNCV